MNLMKPMSPTPPDSNEVDEKYASGYPEGMAPFSDRDALPALIEVMEAAGFHDLDAVLSALDRAEATLQPGHHKARPDIHAARDAAQAGEWRTCWSRAHQATCGLTWAFPPDITTCPRTPDNDKPFVRGALCECGQPLLPGVRFCGYCGTPVKT